MATAARTPYIALMARRSVHARVLALLVALTFLGAGEQVAMYHCPVGHSGAASSQHHHHMTQGGDHPSPPDPSSNAEGCPGLCCACAVTAALIDQLPALTQPVIYRVRETTHWSVPRDHTHVILPFATGPPSHVTA